MRRVIIVALVAVAAAVALVGPYAGAKPKPVKPGQFVTYTCASGDTAGSGTVAWFDKDGKVISITEAKASGATLTAGPAPDRAKAYEWRSTICIPPPTTTTTETTTSTTTSTTLPETTTTVATTTTLPETTTSSTTTSSTTTSTTLPPTTTTVAPTTTTVAPTTTTAGLVFTDTLVLPADGDFYTIWGGFGSAPRCPSGTHLDFAASTIAAPADVTVHYFPQLEDSIVLEMPIDPIIPEPIGQSPWRTRTISYRIVCV